MVETAILEPEVAKRKFTAGVGTLGRSRHSVPGFPGVSWRVAEATFPTLKILVTGPPGPLFFLSLDCTNYDFDPPWIAVLDTNDEPLAWGPLQVFGRSYMHIVNRQKPRSSKDLLKVRFQVRTSLSMALFGHGHYNSTERFGSGRRGPIDVLQTLESAFTRHLALRIVRWMQRWLREGVSTCQTFVDSKQVPRPKGRDQNARSLAGRSNTFPPRGSR